MKLKHSRDDNEIIIRKSENEHLRYEGFVIFYIKNSGFPKALVEIFWMTPNVAIFSEEK